MRQAPNAETWEAVYKSYQQINFSAFDYDTVKHALIEHIKQYYSENFNDYIEDDEFIMLVETFAYISELYAYRLDMNAHENFIGAAQRKQNVLRLVQLVSYTPSRNLPARGLIKVTSVSTTEDVFDSRGTNLANVTVNWNDQNNPFWKEQFILIMNRIMERELGSVLPSDRVQVDDVLFEQYTLKNIPLPNGVIKYSMSTNGRSYPMELVPTTLDSLGPLEQRPTRNSKMKMVYAYDGIGDSSDATGYFFYTKQGTLQRVTRQYDGVTPFQTDVIDVENINNTDVWVNNVDPDTGTVVHDRQLDALGRSLGIVGEWVNVDIANLQNIAFNTNQKRNKYQIETLEQDKIRLIFGDGEFGDIPKGTFDIWVRSSANDDILIPRTALRDKQVSINYTGASGLTENASMTLNAINVISNAAPSESIDSIRQNAPAVYQTQNRMVNGPDYNNYPLKNSNLLKVRTINRTFAGHSRNLSFEDNTGTYKTFNNYGEGLRVFFKDTTPSIEGTADQTVQQFLINTVQPILSSPSLAVFHTVNGLEVSNNEFTDDELLNLGDTITQVENNNGLGYPVALSYVQSDSNARVYIHFEPGIAPSTVTNLLSTGVQYGISVTYTEGSTTSIQDIVFSGPQVTTIQTLVDRINSVLTTNGIDIEAAVDNMNIVLRSTSPTTVFVDVFDGTTNVPGTTPLVDALEQATVGRTTRIDPSILPTGSVPEWRAFSDNVVNPFLSSFTVNSFGDNRILFYSQTNIAVESETTNFWYNNRGDQVINPLTQQSSKDLITILGSNLNTARDGIIGNDTQLVVIENPNYQAGIDIGIANTSRLYTTTTDQNGDFKPDDVTLSQVVGINFSISDYPSTLIGVSPTVPTDNVWDLSNTPVGTSIVGADTLALSSGSSPVSYFFCNELGEPLVDGAEAQFISVPSTASNFNVSKTEYVYFEVLDDGTESFISDTNEVKRLWMDGSSAIVRYRGRSGLFFTWKHVSTDFTLVDPCPTNIHDMYVITNGYFKQLVEYVVNDGPVPTKPTPFELKTSYRDILSAQMLSDSTVMRHGDFKVLFGSKAAPELQAYFKVVRSESATRTDNQIVNEIIQITRDFFDPRFWEMGETFFFEELASTIQGKLYTDIKSVVVVPKLPGLRFGSLYQIRPSELELFYPDIRPRDILFVDTLSPSEIKS